MNHYLYLKVKIKRTGEIGTIIDVENCYGKLLIEFPNGNQSWEYVHDIIKV